MGLWLAQAPLALAASSAFAWRPRDGGWASRVGDMLATAVLYALPYLATAAAIAWPLNMFIAYPGVESLLVLCSVAGLRSEEHTSELQSLRRISYAVFCLK